MDGINKTGAASSLPSVQSTPVAPAAPAVAATPAKAAPANDTSDLFALLADASAPIDTKKVDAIKSLIASGAYPIDAHAVAAKMVALDFPASGGHADA
jgi:negative regulator of flagellin synthesis FlgM